MRVSKQFLWSKLETEYDMYFSNGIVFVRNKNRAVHSVGLGPQIR